MREVLAKSILNKSRRRDPWFLDAYTINPYGGCSFNCLYCYIRGSKYGLQMEDRLSVKLNAPELLEKALALRAQKKQYGIIVLASATDPYLQIEKDRQLTRQLLEIILKYRFPVHVITKSDLVVRDFDLLKEIDTVAILPSDLEPVLAHRAFVTFSISIGDDAVARIFEPGATPPSARFDTLKQAVSAGLHSGVSMMPLLPYISDTPDHLERLFAAAASASCRYVFPASLTLFGSGPADSKTLVMNAIRKHYPGLTAKYESLFASFQIPYSYRDALNARTEPLRKKYKLSSSLTGA